MIVAETAGNSGFQFALAAQSVSLTGESALAEAEPNDTKAQAQAGVGTVIHYTGLVHDFNDQDWIKVTVPAGKKVSVYTTTGSAGVADTQVQVFGIDGTTSIAGPSPDGDLAEVLATPVATAATTYFVVISASSFIFYNPADDPYEAIITVN